MKLTYSRPAEERLGHIPLPSTGLHAVGRRNITCNSTKFAILTTVIFQIVVFWVTSAYLYPEY
jgi:hypothetical protein